MASGLGLVFRAHDQCGFGFVDKSLGFRVLGLFVI